MSYKITILKSEVSRAPKGYNVAEIAYKTEDGKTKGMKVLDFLQKDVFATLKDTKPGDVLNADFEKNAKGFWQFAQVVKTGEKADVATAATPVSAQTKSSGGNWETSAERQARQVMIVRQSSLSNAVALFEATKNTKVTPDNVIDVAKRFESYVLGTDQPQQPTGDIE